MLPGVVLKVTDEDGGSGLFSGSEVMIGLSKHSQDKTRGSVIFWLSREQSEEQFKGEALKVDADASGGLRRVFSASQAVSVSTRSLM